MITSDIQELNISDLNEYEEDRALLLTENEEGYWRKLTLDPNKSVTGTGSPFAYQDNEIISTTNIDESYNNRVSDGTGYVDMYYDFSSGIPTWGIQTSDSATFRWGPNIRNANGVFGNIDSDAQGNARFIFQNPTTYFIYVDTYDPTIKDWIGSVNLDNTTQSPNGTPVVKVSESGIVIVASVHDDSLYRQIQGAYYDPATQTWTKNVQLSIPTATEDANPQVAINDNGDGVAVWQSPQPDGSIAVQAAHFFSATKTWQGFPTTISQGIYENFNPRVGIDNNGNILVIWEQLNPSSNRSLIFYATYDAGTSTWSSSDIVPSTLNDAYSPELSMTSSGDAMAVWIEASTGNYIIEANKYNGATKSWNPFPYDIDTLTTNQYPATVSMSNFGTALAIYSMEVTGISGQYNIQASRYNPSTDQWEQASILDQTSIANSLVQIDTNNSGNAVALWVKESGSALAVFSSTYQEIIKKWSLPDKISDNYTSIVQTQVIIKGNVGASVLGRGTGVTGSSGVVNPNIITANDSIVSFAFRKVQEVGEPEVATDAATKNYVDNAIAAAVPALLETLQKQGLLKEGALEALNKKAEPVKEAKKTKKAKK